MKTINHMKLNPAELRIKMTKELMKVFERYCIMLGVEGFSGNNYFIKVNQVREELFIFHLKCVIEKVNSSLYKWSHESDKKILSLKLNHAERVMFSYMFKRVECPEILTGIEFQITNKLNLFTNESKHYLLPQGILGRP